MTPSFLLNCPLSQRFTVPNDPAWINECSPLTPRLMSIAHEMPLRHSLIYIKQMSLLSFPWPRQMSRYVQTDAGFLCYKPEVHRDMINGTLLYRHSPRVGSYIRDSLHSCLVNSTKTAIKTAQNWYDNTVDYVAGNEKSQLRNTSKSFRLMPWHVQHIYHVMPAYFSSY
jgi:hypothetical protein